MGCEGSQDLGVADGSAFALDFDRYLEQNDRAARLRKSVTY
jgi:hypothetical protein